MFYGSYSLMTLPLFGMRGHLVRDVMIAWTQLLLSSLASGRCDVDSAEVKVVETEVVQDVESDEKYRKSVSILVFNSLNYSTDRLLWKREQVTEVPHFLRSDNKAHEKKLEYSILANGFDYCHVVLNRNPFCDISTIVNPSESCDGQNYLKVVL